MPPGVTAAMMSVLYRVVESRRRSGAGPDEFDLVDTGARSKVAADPAGEGTPT